MSEAQNISDNCVECGICVENCEFLSKYCESPKELADKYLENQFKDKPSIPYCCSLCDGCEVDCPEELNIGRMCLEARQTLVDEGVAPLTPHKIVKKDQDWDLSDEFALTLPAPDKQKASKVFFPGCHLSAYRPSLVMETYEWLRKKDPDTGIILKCCGAPTNNTGFLSDFEKMIEGLGGYGELVDKDEDIIPAIKRAIDSGKPACINVVTDPEVTSPATVMFYQNLSDF